jgi:hypothetical protein
MKYNAEIIMDPDEGYTFGRSIDVYGIGRREFLSLLNIMLPQGFTLKVSAADEVLDADGE